MEYRKLISFGKTSYVVSVPKAWINKNNLKKGDVIAVKENETDLILTSKPDKTYSTEPTEINIKIDGKRITRIKREIVAAYINNNNIINVEGTSLVERAKEIRDCLQNLMALEILEQSATKIVAKDFLNMEKISIQNLIRKMDIITRDMMVDSQKTIHEDNCVNLYHRDEDVDRISYLVFRALKYSLQNPDIGRKYGITNLETLKLWEFIIAIEKVADEVKRISKYISKTKLKDKTAKELMKLYSKLEDSYKETMKAFYKNDNTLAYTISELKEELMCEAESLWDKYWQEKRVPDIIDKFKSLILTIHRMGRLIYSYN